MSESADATRVAIVTGGAQGIGLAIATRLLVDGWMVVSGDIREPAVPAGPQASAARFHAVAQDVSAPGAAEAMVGAAIERFGRLDLLVNNAGIGNARAVHDTLDDDLRRFLEINFVAAFALSRAAVRVMVAGGSIVNIASALAMMGTPTTSSYAASKAALVGLTRQMAVEYGPRGLRINAVAPGLVETALTKARLQGDPEFRRIWKAGTPLPRLGRPEDVAGAVSFLASPDASFINGHVLVVDGGWSVGAPGSH